MTLLRMTLLTTERLFWHCGAHTAEPKLGLARPIPPRFRITNIGCLMCHVEGRRHKARHGIAREGRAWQGKGVQRRGLAVRGGEEGGLRGIQILHQIPAGIPGYAWPPGVSKHAPGTGRVLTDGGNPGEVKHCDVAVFSCAKRNARGMAWAERAGCAH